MTAAEDQAAGVRIVTGAASGMGKAAAELLAREGGGSLILCDLNAERLEAHAAKLRTRGPVETLAGDLSAADFPNRLIGALQGRPVRSLIHCAGLSPTMADAARVMEVNLGATMRLVEVVRPRMQSGGAAVLFASTAAHVLGAGLDAQISEVKTPDGIAALTALSNDNSGLAYCISKRGVMLLVRREAAAFGRAGARIASISPGVIDTPMGRTEMEKQAIMKDMVEQSALQRPARAEEVAAVAVFLCSPQASFVTGVDLLVDGGRDGGEF